VSIQPPLTPGSHLVLPDDVEDLIDGRMTRIVVCEDSHTYAFALQRALEHGGTCSVVGVFPSAEETLAALPALKPDLVTMDLELPGMSGLRAVEQIMSAQPVPILVLSAHLANGSNEPAAALAAGALDALPKSQLDLRDPAGRDAATLRRRAAVLGSARVIRHPRARLNNPGPNGVAPRRPTQMIGICASTGGPQALTVLLGSLPASFPVPIVVVQHIASGFGPGLARLLDDTVDLPVRLAANGVSPTSGVYLAAEGSHLRLGPGRRFVLDHKIPAGSHRPSGDVLLCSMAERLGADAVAVVLTGMGRDGARGVEAVHAAGGLTIAQDERSSIIFGMPKAAIESGAELVLDLESIAPRLLRLASAVTR
jgi:two-component system, chemotaxis family, protein-glutamate methylesterase/glutaminase